MRRKHPLSILLSRVAGVYLLVVVLTSAGCHLFPPLAGVLCQDCGALVLTESIVLDISDPNIRSGGAGGFRYELDGVSYAANYLAWEAWSCSEGPAFFAAWDDTSNTVWLGHCPETLFLESITVTTGGNAPLPIQFFTVVAGAHEPTYQLVLHPDNYRDIEAGETRVRVVFSYGG